MSERRTAAPKVTPHGEDKCWLIRFGAEACVPTPSTLQMEIARECQYLAGSVTDK